MSLDKNEIRNEAVQMYRDMSSSVEEEFLKKLRKDNKIPESFYVYWKKGLELNEIIFEMVLMGTSRKSAEYVYEAVHQILTELGETPKVGAKRKEQKKIALAKELLERTESYLQVSNKKLIYERLLKFFPTFEEALLAAGITEKDVIQPTPSNRNLNKNRRTNNNNNNSNNDGSANSTYRNRASKKQKANRSKSRKQRN